jgi:hypothetical protein
MAASSPPFSYETRLNILHKPLETIDERALADACEYKWYNQTLCKVNDSVVRMAVAQGEYHWHKHDEDDEFFYVVEGHLSSIWKGVRSSYPRDRELSFLKGRSTERALTSEPSS